MDDAGIQIVAMMGVHRSSVLEAQVVGPGKADVGRVDGIMSGREKRAAACADCCECAQRGLGAMA